jgi:hypothetical protein
MPQLRIEHLDRPALHRLLSPMRRKSSTRENNGPNHVTQLVKTPAEHFS